MKPLTKLVLCLASACLTFTAIALAEPPPLIDRELFFDEPEISGAQLSPDGKYIAFMKPLNKTRNIWVKRADEPFEKARLVTADTKRPIPGFFWTRDGKYLLFVQDLAGDENYNVFAVDPAAEAASGSQAPAARNLTDAKGVRAMLYAVPKSAPDILYAGINDRDKAWHDLYRVKISTGERTLLRKNTDRIMGWIYDLKDEPRLAVRSADNGDTEVLRIEGDGLKKIYSCNVFETCAPIRFHKDNKRVYFMTNKGDDLNLTQLSLFDPESGKLELVETDPMKRVDFSGAMVSDLTDELIATVYNDEKLRWYWKNKDFESDFKHLQRNLPGKEVRFGSHTKDERTYLISAASDTDPGSTYLFNRDTKKLTLQYKLREKLPQEHLATMQAIRYESADGMEIPAYLTLPKGVPAKNLPMILVPHGGPWARDGWGFNGMAQFLANRGYAVLQPNFRGSTGYGKKFLNAGNLEWGQKMQADLTEGVKHLAAKNIADPKRAGIMGGSYGGYAALAGVAFTPDVYAAAVSIVGPSNLITLLESIPPYWEAGRMLFHKRMGDPKTPEGRAQLERQSPLNSATKIKTPLLVAQGANDPRVNKAESDQIVIALRNREFPVEYIVAPDEGHGFARPVNNMAMYAAAEKFLAKHLKGRYQEGASPEVTARLKEITVDPKTVTLAKKVDAASVAVPKLGSPLVAGVYKYKATLQMGGQTATMNTTTEIKEDAGNWLVVDTVTTPMGEVTDRTVLDKNTLVVLKRNVKQGPVTIHLEVNGNKATGSMNVQGKEQPIDVDLGGPLFADAAGSGNSIAHLPLAEGYTATFRNFDLQKQKTKLMQLKVDGAESVTVPAGTFEAYKVLLSPADGGPGSATLWVAKDARKVVKMSSVMPQMGGATMTAELQ